MALQMYIAQLRIKGSYIPIEVMASSLDHGRPDELLSTQGQDTRIERHHVGRGTRPTVCLCRQRCRLLGRLVEWIGPVECGDREGDS